MRPFIGLAGDAEIETTRQTREFHAPARKLRLTGMRRRPPC